MPRKIAQTWLDSASDTFMANDFAAYVGHVLLPMRITTNGGGAWIIADEAALRTGFDAWIEMMREQRATLLVRRVQEAEMRSNGELWALYSTDLLNRNAAHVVAPYDSALCLKRVGDQWKCVGVASGLINSRWPIVVPRVGVPDLSGRATLNHAAVRLDALRLPDIGADGRPTAVTPDRD